MSSDVLVQFVTFTSRELGLRLNQKWSFVSIRGGEVRIHDELIAKFDKRGGKVVLSPAGPRELVRWVAWAIQDLCPDSEAQDDEATPSDIKEAPMSPEEAEKKAKSIVGARLAAIAKEADPDGRAQEAVALVMYLVKRELLELCGSPASVARAVFPLLQDEIDESIGSKLEDVLLELDEVEELYAETELLSKIVRNNDHIFDS